MSYDKSKITIYGDDFYEKKGLPKPHRVEFDRTKVKKDELDVINNYFANLCLDLTLYSELFTEARSINVLNEFSPLVFSRIEKAYIEKLCLSLTCLLDPEQTGKNENLSLERVITQCECPELNEKYKELFERYESTGIKSWRNKLLTHNDLDTLMGKKPLELKFDHDDIEYILKLIQEIFNDISDPTVHTDIKVILPFDQDGKAFIIKLELLLKMKPNKRL